MKRIIQRLLRILLGDYALYQVWRLQAPLPGPSGSPMQLREIQAADLQAANIDPELACCGWYLGAQARGYGLFDGSRLLGLAFYWWGARYAQRRSWPIPEGAAKLVHIVTAPAARGRGIAPMLIQASASRMRQAGHAPLYARIWHSHRASQRAFARAGWAPIGWIVQINPLRRPVGWSWCWRPRDASRSEGHAA